MESCLKGLDETEFSGAYICPSADLAAVYSYNPDDKYHACYWTSVAIRVNRGFEVGLFDDYTNSGHLPGWDIDSGGEARFTGKTCPNYNIGHWRSVYMPSPETIRNPNGTVFSGDTNDKPFDGWHDNDPGAWHMRPGWGWVHGHLGFDRHGGRIVLSFVDGHAGTLAFDVMMRDFSIWHNPDETTGHWMVQRTGEDGCGGTRIHSLPPPVVE